MICDNCDAKNLDHREICWKCGDPLSQQPAAYPSTIVPKTSIEQKSTIDTPTISEVILNFEGMNGQIELYKDKLIIKRQGFFAVLSHGFTKGNKTIYLNQITGIQLKLGGPVFVGYIQFTLPGGIESSKGAFAATQDENSVTFTASENVLATYLKEKIEELMHKSRQSTIQTVQVSSADEIKKFKQLLDEGIITKDEFDKKKKELLGL